MCKTISPPLREAAKKVLPLVVRKREFDNYFSLHNFLD